MMAWLECHTMPTNTRLIRRGGNIVSLGCATGGKTSSTRQKAALRTDCRFRLGKATVAVISDAFLFQAELSQKESSYTE